jgi:DNA-binding PadR family transcriptional regulator
MNPFQQEILETIAVHDGQYSWYQLDRALSQFSPRSEDNLPLMHGLSKILRDLENEGLIQARTDDPSPQPVYVITVTGRQTLDRDRVIPYNPRTGATG